MKHILPVHWISVHQRDKKTWSCITQHDQRVYASVKTSALVQNSSVNVIYPPTSDDICILILFADIKQTVQLFELFPTGWTTERASVCKKYSSINSQRCSCAGQNLTCSDCRSNHQSIKIKSSKSSIRSCTIIIMQNIQDEMVLNST